MRDHILTRHFTEVKKEDLPKQFEYLLSSQSRSIEAAEGETVISGGHGFQTRVSSDGFQCLSCMKTFSNRSKKTNRAILTCSRYNDSDLELVKMSNLVNK